MIQDRAFENGGTVGAYEPDMAAEIDERNGWKDPAAFKPLTITQALESRAEAMRWFLVECWLPENSTDERRRAKEAATRFVALSVLLNPKLFEKGMSYQRLAKELEVSRAELSKVALSFSDKAAVQCRGQRKKETRDRNAKARIKKHNENRTSRDGAIQTFAGIFGRALEYARGGHSIGSGCVH